MDEVSATPPLSARRESYELPRIKPYRTILNLILLGEFLVEYTRNSIFGIVRSGVANDLELLPPFMAYTSNIITFSGFYLGIIFSIVSDSLVDKFIVYMVSQFIFSFCPIIYFLVNADGVGESSRTFLLLAIHFSSIIYPMTFGIRSAFIAEQKKLPEKLLRIRRFMFFVIWVRCLAKLIYGLFSLIKKEESFFKINSYIMVILNVICFAAIFIKRRELLKQKHDKYSFVNAVKFWFKRPSEKKHVGYLSSENITELSSKRFGKIMITFLPLITFGTLSFLLHSTLLAQFGRYAAGKKKWNANPYLAIDGALLVALLAVEELTLMPLLKKCFIYISDLQLVSISSFILVLSGIFAAIVQYFFDSSQIIPRTNMGNFKIYNGGHEHVSLTSDLFEEEIVKPFDLLQKVIDLPSHMPQKSITVRLTSNSFDFETVLDIVETAGISYVLSSNGTFRRLLDIDPFYFAPTGFNNPRYPVTYIFPADPDLLGEFVLFDRYFRKLVATATIGDADKKTFFSVPPGKYNMRFDGVNNSFYDKNETTWFRFGGIYSLMLHSSPEVEISVFAEATHKSHYVMTVPAIFMRNLALSLAYVSTYHFAYLESPIQLRSTVFSYIFAIESVGLGLHLWIKAQYWYVDVGYIALIIYSSLHFVATVLFVLSAMMYQDERYYFTRYTLKTNLLY